MYKKAHGIDSIHIYRTGTIRGFRHPLGILYLLQISGDYCVCCSVADRKIEPCTLLTSVTMFSLEYTLR